MAGYTVSYSETIAIRGFLTYLNRNYSKQVNTTDTYLIAAVAAVTLASWSGGKIIGNNPFQLRGPVSVSVAGTGHITVTPGPLLRFSTMAEGFIAAAKQLIALATKGNEAIMQLALNALKRGGNQAAGDFLAALAMTNWNKGYGVSNWQDAYNQNANKLLGFYVHIKGIQLVGPAAKPRAPHQPPLLPRNYYVAPQRHYLDPWAARSRYGNRHEHHGGLQATLDAKARRR